ncbi:DUF2779 domain-containing protein [Mycoplasma sp. HS2188]|uniref:DUF2779 domain-containing protein n=1 Tax=Mycoplasma sp. HS2188 TaxID=2976765 RepID=UPI0021AA52AA|nr:DUF2779 domain-containing protein [Mycoplasma sp. HS2188]MCT4469878.1 DUF2779 domain-containing protein [Mycoplasma sp. HS2188]
MKIFNLKTLDSEFKKDLKIINFAKFKTAYTSQPWFIWAPRNSANELENIPRVDANGFELYVQNEIKDQNINTQNKHNFDSFDNFVYDSEDDDDSALISLVSEKEREIFLSNEWNYKLENSANIFVKARRKALDFFVSQFSDDLQNLDDFYFSRTLFSNENIEQINEEWNKFISSKRRFIIDPSFVYFVQDNDNNFAVKANAMAYDAKTKTLYFEKFKSSTELIDYLKSFYVYNVAQKMGIEIHDIQYLIYSPEAQDYKKGEIPFRFVDGIYGSNTPAGVLRITTRKIKDAEELKIRGLINTGIATSLGFYFDEEQNIRYTGKIIEAIKNNLIFNNPTKAKVKDFIDNRTEIELKKSNKSLANFDDKIALIVQAYNSNLPIYSSLDKEYGWTYQFTDDYSGDFGKNPDLNRIKELILGERYKYSSGINGTGKPLKSLDADYINLHRQIVDNFYEAPNYFTLNSLNLISKLMVKDARIVWYDYEGLSSIITIFDGLKSWSQIPHQVSVIVSQNGKTIFEKDTLKDPKSVNLIDLVDVIKDVYQDKADIYVVFNKGYENSRNLEIRDMVELRYKNNDIEFISLMQQRGFSSFLEFESVILHIVDNTFDLLDFFTKVTPKTDDIIFASNFVKYNNFHNLSDQSLSLDFKNFKGSIQDYTKLSNAITDKAFNGKIKSTRIMELLGYTSIKKIEKIITKTKSYFNYRTQIKEYATLEVKNGSAALEIAINRNNGNTSDLQWAHIAEKLKEYCHNDVVAMIAVYEFILAFIADVFPDIYQYEYQLQANQTLSVDFENKKLITVEE